MFCFFNTNSEKLANIEYLLGKSLEETIKLKREIRKMALDLTALTEEVARLETVEESAVTLIKALADEVALNKNDPAALQALVDRIKASDTTLADAVAANTPTAPAV